MAIHAPMLLLPMPLHAVPCHAHRTPGRLAPRSSLHWAGGRGRTSRLVLAELWSLGPLGPVPAGWRRWLRRTATHAPVGDHEERNAKWVPHGTCLPIRLLASLLGGGGVGCLPLPSFAVISPL
ncbi:hypothetical protein LZ31DRAFT_387723 [Colletotrichum somersetense]|nr:hypothetical protein LZ31DRAFT_387723 [Colletotrichum somersetense]